MKYSKLVSLYDSLGATTKRLEKASILATFLKENLKVKGENDWIYLLRGKILPDHDLRELGISRQLVIKTLSSAFSIKEEDVDAKFAKLGDLGAVAEALSTKKKQGNLFSKELMTHEVVSTLRNILSVEGKGAVGKKIDAVSGLLSRASPRESLYIMRTLLADLRIGVADSLVLDAITNAFFEGNKEAREKLEEKYNVVNDFLIVVNAVLGGDMKSLDKLSLKPGVPFQAMLSTKVADVDEGFEVCGKPAAFEFKYDGFRVMIHKSKGNVWLFTRKMENVTTQFPDVVETVKEYVKGDDFILDSEVVGYDPKTKKYKPFEHISQRIRRKYNIEELQEKLPVEINIFDVLYLNGESVMEKPFIERRKIVEKIVKEKKLLIRPAQQLITDSPDEAREFYDSALKEGEEGVMIKKIDAPYKQGRYVGYMVKLKPVLQDLDLVVVAAEHGTGKRGGWFTSYIVACRDGDEFFEVGRVSSGLKEKESEGFTYEEMTKMIKDIIIEEKDGLVIVEPKIVVSVNYQNVQKSPEYTSGYALRFPRITAHRPDRGTTDIADLSDIEKAFKKGLR